MWEWAKEKLTTEEMNNQLLSATVSCNSYNISHPPCCKLAQVVALSSPPFNVKLSVWLPSSCNAAPLIAKAKTRMKEVAFCQSIRQYQILCCCWVSRLGVLNVQLQEESECTGNILMLYQNWKLIFLQSASYIEKRIEYLRLSCFSSVTKEKNIP